MDIAQLRAEINLCSNDVENELDPKSIELGFLIEKREPISDFSYKFLSDCRKGFAVPYIEDHEIKPKEDWKFRTFATSFGLPNRYNYPFKEKYYDYLIDGHLEQLAQISHNPIHETTLYMVVSATLLNGRKYKPYSGSDYEMGYFRPLYIGKTDNLAILNDSCW